MSAELFRSPEKERSLDGFLAQIAQSNNEKYGPFLRSDCSIDMDAFAGLAGYDLAKDKKDIEAKEREWSYADTTNENMIANLKDRGLETPEQRLNYWRRNKEASEPEKMEKGIVGLLHKALHPEFIVVRTSTYDDYFGQIDNLIIDPKTQKVIGAFDEVRGEESFARRQEKEKKVRDFARKGGAKVKYGINAIDGKLLKGELKNIPIFMIALTKKELNDLLAGMDYNAEGRLTGSEAKTFDGIMASFEEQVKMLEEEKKNIPAPVFANIQTFKNSLERMKSLASSSV